MLLYFKINWLQMQTIGISLIFKKKHINSIIIVAIPVVSEMASRHTVHIFADVGMRCGVSRRRARCDMRSVEHKQGENWGNTENKGWYTFWDLPIRLRNSTSDRNNKSLTHTILQRGCWTIWEWDGKPCETYKCRQVRRAFQPQH